MDDKEGERGGCGWVAGKGRGCDAGARNSRETDGGRGGEMFGPKYIQM